MINNLEEVRSFIDSVQVLFAVIVGMCVQFILGDKRGGKVALTIAISSMFVALYFVPSMVDILNAVTFKLFDFKIGSDSNIAIMLYASSSLISVEMMAIAIKLLPKVAEEKVSKYLGVENDKNSNS